MTALLSALGVTLLVIVFALLRLRKWWRDLEHTRWWYGP